MAKQTSIGVGGIARKVKNIYIGVNGVARKVKAGYIGVNGVARMFFQPGWWLPDGIASSICVAAYQFKNAKSESNALINQVTSSLYPLSTISTNMGAPIWANTTGFRMKYGQALNNADLLNHSGIKSIIVNWRVEEHTQGKVYVVRTKDYCFKKASTDNQGNYNSYNLTLNWGGGHRRFDGNGYYGGLTGIQLQSKRLYLDTYEKSGHNIESSVFIPSIHLIGGTLNNYYPNEQTLFITAVAFYTEELSLAQFLNVRAKMIEAGAL